MGEAGSMPALSRTIPINSTTWEESMVLDATTGALSEC